MPPDVPSDIQAESTPTPSASGKILANPMLVPPFGSSWCYGSGQQLFAGPTSGLFTGPNATLRLPGGNVGVIRELNLVVNAPLVTSLIAFVLLVNGNPVEGLTVIEMPQVTAPGLSYSPNDFFVTLPAGAIVRMQAIVTDAASYTLSFLLRGWCYPGDLAHKFPMDI